jgi:excinuclease ABC subunit B
LFKIDSPYQPAGDQPEAIKQLVAGIRNGDRHQTLLGVTGSGKTFTAANIVQEIQRPTLVLTHNKTLVAQLYGEFKSFFPDNLIEYFVSYYDYYQPEAYIPSSGLYIEKDLSINAEIEKLRLSTVTSLLSGRQDILVVASVSCIYGMGNPHEYKKSILYIKQGEKISRNGFLYKLVESLYSRTTEVLGRSNFKVTGDTVDIYLPYTDDGFRITFFGDEIEEIETFNPVSGKKIKTVKEAVIFPANVYVTGKDLLLEVIHQIQDDLVKQVTYYKSIEKHIEAARLEERVNFDLEMMRELGYCSGIENYSRYMDKREIGARPYTLLDYFPKDFLLLVDESHASIPQIGAMYGGDRSRKTNLVDYGFRLPSAFDNRPLNFPEFEQIVHQAVYISATPGNYELEKCEGVLVEQIVRPTGLLDPPIEVRPTMNQIDDLLNEIQGRIDANERVLVTTLTKRMAEELSKYFFEVGIRNRYIHSEVDTMERVEILRDLRLGKFDVLVGVNLLREGLDLPEVSLVAIMDADKEGFLRNERSLTQTAGRAARNVNGKVIFYADKITGSMKRTMDETDRKREKQIAYNIKHNITPKTVFKSAEDIIKSSAVLDIRSITNKAYYEEPEVLNVAADSGEIIYTEKQLDKAIEEARKKMQQASKKTEFLEAAKYRDEMMALEKKRKK